jgi:transcriptional regulator with XRE-family HTH domain
MSLADKIRKLRESKDLSLDDLAARAGISKTYLWELERDTESTKKPSADVLLKIATALSTTLADILSLETVKIEQTAVELTPSLRDFQNRMAAQNTPLTTEDLRDLAVMKFRGGQPQTADEWHQLYLLLDNSTRKRKKS